MGVVWSLAGGIGPLLGETLTQYISWRWNWWINLPISGLSFLILCFCLHVHNPRTSLLQGAQAVDWLGILLVLGMTLMTLLGLNLGGVISPWGSPKVICLVVFGFVASIIFALYEAKFTQNPLMQMRILRTPSNLASLLVCFMHGMVGPTLILLEGKYLHSAGKCVFLVLSTAILPICQAVHATYIRTPALPHNSSTIDCRRGSWSSHPSNREIPRARLDRNGALISRLRALHQIRCRHFFRRDRVLINCSWSGNRISLSTTHHRHPVVSGA